MYAVQTQSLLPFNNIKQNKEQKTEQNAASDKGLLTVKPIDAAVHISYTLVPQAGVPGN